MISYNPTGIVRPFQIASFHTGQQLQMKINFFNLTRAHMMARRKTSAELVQVKHVSADFSASFITVCSSQHVSPSGSPVRRSKHMRAKWRLFSPVRRPKGRCGERMKWFVMVDETDSAEGEEVSWEVVKKGLTGLLLELLLLWGHLCCSAAEPDRFMVWNIFLKGD